MARYDPTSLLERQASIIAENDTHAVVAIRLPKAWIGENLRFFAALAEVATRTAGTDDAKRPMDSKIG